MNARELKWDGGVHACVLYDDVAENATCLWIHWILIACPQMSDAGEVHGNNRCGQ